MARTSRNAGRFVTAVHRRWAGVRILESVGLGMAGASAAGLILVPILGPRIGDEMGMTIFVLGAGIVTGFLWGVARRPGLLAAAMEADRQLGLDDLLGTVVLGGNATVADATTAEWMRAIFAIADHQCEKISPSQVAIRRLGLRAWGGVTVLMAMLVAVSLFFHAANSGIAGLNGVGMGNGEFAAHPELNRNQVGGAGARNAAMGRPGSLQQPEEDSRRTFEQNHPDESAAAGTAKLGAASNASNGGPGSGTGQASANVKPGAGQVGTAAGNGRPGSSMGTADGGNGAASQNGTAGATRGGVVGASAPAGVPAPAWESAQWGSERDAAMAAVGAGKIPPEDAEMVKEYFQRN